MIQHVHFDMEWLISVIFCCWLALFAYRIKPRPNNPNKHFRSKSISFTHPSPVLMPWQRQWFNPGTLCSAFRRPPKLRQARAISWRRAVECWTGMSVTSDPVFLPTWKLTLCKPLLVSSLSHMALKSTHGFSHSSPSSNQQRWRGGFAFWNGVWSFKLALESSLSSWANKSASTVGVRWAGAPGGCHSLLCWAGSHRRQCCHTFIQLYIT